MADESTIPDGWIHPDVRAAIDADPEIRPEAKGLMTAAVSRAVRASGDPDVIRATIAAAKAGEGGRYLVPPNPPPAEPGSLAFIAERFRAAQGPYAAMGLSPLADPPTFAPEQRKAPAPRPAPPGPIGSLEAVAEAWKARMAQRTTMGLKPIDPPKKGA